MHTDSSTAVQNYKQSYSVFSTDGIPIQVFEQGNLNGPIVYLVHGVLTNHHFYNDLANFLSTKYRVIRYDQRGHGESGDRQGNNCTLRQLGADLATIVRHVQGADAAGCSFNSHPHGPAEKKAYFVGHSMGGMTLGAWVHYFPEDISTYAAGMALCNTGFAEIINHTKVIGFHIPNWKILKDLSWIVACIPINNSRFSRFLLKYLNYHGKIDLRQLNDYIATAQTVSPPVTRKIIVEINKMDFINSIGNITVPTTVVASDQDHFLDAVLGENIAHHLSANGYLRKFSLFKGTGHDTVHERPKRFKKIIDDALTDAFPETGLGVL